MNDHSYRWQEIKAVLIWLLLPFFSILIAVKIILTWLAVAQIDGGAIPILVGCLGCVAVCWSLAKRMYLEWYGKVLQGGTQSGKTLYHVSADSTHAETIVFIGLTAVFAFVLRANVGLQPVLTLILGGLIWSMAIGVFMPAFSCILGQNGIWVTHYGLKSYIPYLTVSKILLERNSELNRYSVRLFRGDSISRSFRLPLPIPRDAVNILSEFVSVENDN